MTYDIPWRTIRYDDAFSNESRSKYYVVFYFAFCVSILTILLLLIRIGIRVGLFFILGLVSVIPFLIIAIIHFYIMSSLDKIYFRPYNGDYLLMKSQIQKILDKLNIPFKKGVTKDYIVDDSDNHYGLGVTKNKIYLTISRIADFDSLKQLINEIDDIPETK